MEYMVEVKDLKKAYGKVNAVKGISFHVEQGKLFALLGPNGAGKSTTIDIITTFLKPDSGAVYIDTHQLGKEDDKIRQSIGAVFQDSLLDKKLSVEENLMTRGHLYGLKKKAVREAVENTIALCDLQEIRKQRYETLSGGQRRRCDIARALIHSPKLLFLDEPTTGLDPKTRAMVWELIQKLRKEQGMTVFLTTHYMEEASGADDIIVIDHGEIVAEGTPEYLKETFAKDVLKLESNNISEIETILNTQQIAYTLHHGQVHIELAHTTDALAILEVVKSSLTSFEVIHGTMDDAFLAIIHREEMVL